MNKGRTKLEGPVEKVLQESWWEVIMAQKGVVSVELEYQLEVERFVDRISVGCEIQCIKR